MVGFSEILPHMGWQHTDTQLTITTDKTTHLRLFVVGALIYGGGFPWSNSIETSTSWSGGGWFISAKGGLWTTMCNTWHSIKTTQKNQVELIWLFHQTTEWFVSSSCLLVTQNAAKKHGKAPEIHCCSQAWTLWQRQSTSLQWQMPKGKGHFFAPVAADTWPMTTCFFSGQPPQQVFNLESIVGICSPCFFEQFVGSTLPRISQATVKILATKQIFKQLA